MNYEALISAINDAHQQAQAGAAGAVNRHLILRNLLIGVVQPPDCTDNSAPAVRKSSDRQPTPLPIHKLLELSWTHLVELVRLDDNDKDQTKVEYATGGLDHRLFVSRYLVALPKPEELQRLVETDRALWEQHHPGHNARGSKPAQNMKSK